MPKATLRDWGLALVLVLGAALAVSVPYWVFP